MQSVSYRMDLMLCSLLYALTPSTFIDGSSHMCIINYAINGYMILFSQPFFDRVPCLLLLNRTAMHQQRCRLEIQTNTELILSVSGSICVHRSSLFSFFFRPDQHDRGQSLTPSVQNKQSRHGNKRCLSPRGIC